MPKKTYECLVGGEGYDSKDLVVRLPEFFQRIPMKITHGLNSINASYPDNLLRDRAGNLRPEGEIRSFAEKLARSRIEAMALEVATHHQVWFAKKNDAGKLEKPLSAHFEKYLGGNDHSILSQRIGYNPEDSFFYCVKLTTDGVLPDGEVRIISKGSEKEGG